MRRSVLSMMVILLLFTSAARRAAAASCITSPNQSVPRPYDGVTLPVGTDQLCGFGAPDMLVRVEPADQYPNSLEDISSIEEIPIASADTNHGNPTCIHLERPLETPGTYLTADANVIRRRIEVTADAPTPADTPPQLSKQAVERPICGTGVYGYYVFVPDDETNRQLYEWTVRDSDREVVEQNAGTTPTVFGTDNDDTYRDGETYEIRIRTIHPDGTRSPAATHRLTFRYLGQRESQMTEWAGLFEAVIPDVRFEFDDGLRPILSFPVGATLWQTRQTGVCTVCGRLSAFNEPQIQFDGAPPRSFSYLRGQLAIALPGKHALFASTESGYLFAGDGHGPGFGVGLGFGDFDVFGLHFVARGYALADRSPRFDFAIDVEWFPFDGVL